MVNFMFIWYPLFNFVVELICLKIWKVNLRNMFHFFRKMKEMRNRIELQKWVEWRLDRKWRHDFGSQLHQYCDLWFMDNSQKVHLMLLADLMNWGFDDVRSVSLQVCGSLEVWIQKRSLKMSKFITKMWAPCSVWSHLAIWQHYSYRSKLYVFPRPHSSDLS